MKTTLYNLLFLLILAPSMVFCANTTSDHEFKGRHTKEKKITKQFNVAVDALLKINNSYGNVDISTWDQHQVSIEVIIKTNGNDEARVAEKLDEITVEFKQSSAGVSARTLLERESSSWWSSLFGNNANVSMEINYIIRAPATNNMDLSNDYGNIFLDKLQGNAKISCDYGRMDIGELHGSQNQLNFDYSRNSHFGYINQAVIRADYSEFTVDDAKSLDLHADYTNSNIKRVELLKFSCDYGSLSVDKVKRIAGSGDYLSTKLGDVHRSLDLNLDYGNLAVDRIMKGAGSIKIHSDYTGLKIGYDEEHSFRFSINTSYGGVKGLEGFELEKQHEASSSKSYTGYHLRNAGGGTIEIASSYGSITFQKQ